MIIKCYYRRNLKMSQEKLAAQVGHVVAHFSVKHQCVPEKVIVLKASDTKFEEYKENPFVFVQQDLGLTEVAKDTETVMGWVINE